jgi:hypothetical protein
MPTAYSAYFQTFPPLNDQHTIDAYSSSLESPASVGFRFSKPGGGRTRDEAPRVNPIPGPGIYGARPAAKSGKTKPPPLGCSFDRTMGDERLVTGRDGPSTTATFEGKASTGFLRAHE